MSLQLASPPESVADSMECRVYERQRCDVPAACRPASALGNPEAKWDAVIRNVSQAGARLVLRRRFEPGTGLAIEIPGADEPYTVLAKVVHVQREEDGAWSLGCRFISELSDSEQDRLLQWTSPQEEMPQPIPNVHLRLLGQYGTLLQCRVSRFQPNGEWPLSAGHILDLRGKKANGRAWKLTVRVVECSAREGAWTLSCQLAKSPSAAQMLSALGEEEH